LSKGTFFKFEDFLLEDSLALLHPDHVRSVHHEDEAMDLEIERINQSTKDVYMSNQIQRSLLTKSLKAKEPIGICEA
jgi:hypothetical protein